MHYAPDYTASTAKRGAVAETNPARFIQLNKEAAARKQLAYAATLAWRLEREMDVVFSGTPAERGRLAIEQQLQLVREAESLDRLFSRDKHVGGMLEAARAFGALPLDQVWRLRSLLNNAFEHRRRELMP